MFVVILNCSAIICFKIISPSSSKYFDRGSGRINFPLNNNLFYRQKTQKNHYIEIFYPLNYSEICLLQNQAHLSRTNNQLNKNVLHRKASQYNMTLVSKFLWILCIFLLCHIYSSRKIMIPFSSINFDRRSGTVNIPQKNHQYYANSYDSIKLFPYNNSIIIIRSSSTYF